MAQSPSSSPRLPSPPPMAEDQVGPTSPGVHGLEDLDKIGQASADYGASRRIRPGTKSEDMHEGPPLMEFSEIDSAFQLTEHLKALFASLTTSEGNRTIPISRASAQQLVVPPQDIDRGIWLYELCRLLVARVNTIIVSLFSDDPPCSATTCVEMRASEWQYLCAAHDPPKSCCAIDYCCHTLDWAATQLTSSKLFPSRLALGTGENTTTTQQIRKMTEIFRRVYRIFAHAWFQHRDVFWRVEGRTGLYVFFKTVSDEFRLIPEDSYTIPPEAEGGEEGEADLREDRESRAEIAAVNQGDEEQGKKDTQKRHHRMMPERQSSVSTVIHEEVEEEEEEDDAELEVIERGKVEQLPSPPEETDVNMVNLDAARNEDSQHSIEDLRSGISESIEVTVDETHITNPDESLKGQTETTITAPLTEETETSDEAPAPEASKSKNSDVVAVPMDPETSKAGEAEEADKTVAD